MFCLRNPFLGMVLTCGFVDYVGLSSVTPVLPLFLAKVVDDPDVRGSWFGAILSIQFFAVVVGHLFWGNMSRRWGALTCLLIIMLIDAVAFTLSAFSTDVFVLAFSRALAGFCSPMVPIMSILLRWPYPNAGDSLEAMIWFAVSNSLGFASGSAIVTRFYPTIGWTASCMLTAGLALVIGMLLYCFSQRGDARFLSSPTPLSLHLTGLASLPFVLQSFTAFNLGWMLNMQLTLVVLRNDELGRSLIDTGNLLLVIAAATPCSSLLIVPTAVAFFGHGRCMILGKVLSIVVSLLLPFVDGHLYLLSNFLFITSWQLIFAVNQKRLPGIAKTYNNGDVTTLISVSRVSLACGQAAAPFFSTCVFAYGWYIAWYGFALMQGSLLLLYPLLRVPMYDDGPMSQILT